TLKKLKHPNLPSVTEVIEQQDEYFIVMDYIEGISLEKMLEEKGVPQEEEVVRYAIQLCDVLSYLHTRKPAIIYRDMKPSNIVLRPDGTVVLIDFGTAREFKEDALGDTNNLGTRGYAAPEQFGKRGQTDARTDIYCLGMTLYQLLTAHHPGEPPYEIYPITSWNPKLSSGLERIIHKCIQKNPKDRFQSADELMSALLDYREYGIRQKKQYKKRLGIAGVMTGLALMNAGAMIWLHYKAEASEQMSRLVNGMFVLTVFFALAAVILFFSYDNRKTRIRRKKRRGEEHKPPVTVELAPRTLYVADRTQKVEQENTGEWKMVQDITFVHASAIEEEAVNKTIRTE
ncbi:MAG: serine/threonine protein kinase, partial [Lachnospiraceae bacterium]|nr:serine/threonine protein kinase [Lachnospiraceae bacterium]